MKKLTTLLLAAGLVFAASAPASAVDVKMDGEYIFQFIRSEGANFNDADSDNIRQRVRLGMTASVSENLSGYFQIDSKWFWGNNADSVGGNGTAFEGAKTDVRMYRAYIDWMVPQTDIKVRMGRHDISLPAVAGGKNPVLWNGDPVDGITIAAPVTDWLDLTAFWARAARWQEFEGVSATDTDNTTEVDVFGLVANTKFDGFTFAPYLLYGSYGHTESTLGEDIFGNQFPSAQVPGWTNRSNGPAGKSQAYWAGFSGSMTVFDPFVVKASFIYGDRNYTDGQDTPSQRGWFADLSLSYKTAYGTPELYGFYGSGDPEHAQYAYQGNLPTIKGRYAAGGTYGYFNGMTTMDNELQNNHTGSGFWGVRLGMKNISFIQDLSHDIGVVYVMGTNDSTNTALANPQRYLTTDDSLVEFDFGTTYQIYKNLSARFEAAYIIEDFETGADKGRANKYDNAWALNLEFKYKF